MMYCVNCEYPVTYEEKMANRCSHCGKHPDHEQTDVPAIIDWEQAAKMLAAKVTIAYQRGQHNPDWKEVYENAKRIVAER